MLSKKERVAIVVSFRVVALILALVVVAVNAISWGLLREGIDDTLIARFESDPPEGYQY